MGFLKSIFGGGGSAESGDSPESLIISATKLTSEGNYYGERGNLNHAIRCFKKAISVCPNYVPAYLSLSLAYREKGEYQLAMSILSSAPSVVHIGDEPWDYAFEIAFNKAGVLIAEYSPSGFKGNMKDLVSCASRRSEEARRTAVARIRGPK